MRFLLTSLLAANLASWAAAQQSTYDPTNATIFQLSSTPEFAFLLEEALSLATSEGSATAEVLRIATEIVPNSFESWYPAFHNFAEKTHALAERIDPTIDPVGAREAYFRASKYYRDSVFLLVGNSTDPRLYSAWSQALQSFSQAIALLQPSPGEAISLTAPTSSIGPFVIPAYFYKASASNTAKLPTIIVGTGYDAAQEDCYHIACAEILKRGLNCITYEGPGQPTSRRQGHGFIPDWWSVVTPVVDYLFTRPDVDTSRLVLLGDSFGGLLAPLAASREHRLSAMVLLDGFPNFRQTLIEQFPTELIALYNSSREAEFNEYVLAAVAQSNVSASFRMIWDYTFWSLDEVEPFKAWKRLELFNWGMETARAIGGLPVFVAKGQDDMSTTNEPELARQYLENGRPNGKNLTYYHVFETALGAGEHTSIGAESQVYISILGWLSDVWGGYKFGNMTIKM